MRLFKKGVFWLPRALFTTEQVAAGFFSLTTCLFEKGPLQCQYLSTYGLTVCLGTTAELVQFGARHCSRKAESLHNTFVGCITVKFVFWDGVSRCFPLLYILGHQLCYAKLGFAIYCSVMLHTAPLND